MPVQNITIYVVDDDTDVIDSLVAATSSLGYTCRAFGTAEALLEFWENRQCACVVLDVNLPGISGLELLVRIRQSDTVTPVIIYTGRVTQSVIVAAKQLPNVTVLEKGRATPTFPQHLAEVLT